MPIKDHYSNVIHQIMYESRIAHPQTQPPFSMLPSSSWVEVVQYTDWYIVGDGYVRRQYPNSHPHYRYDRYINLLKSVLTDKSELSNRPIAHIDIGCGSGVFSWAFLDHMREFQSDYKNIKLYGYDYCPQMIYLANAIQNKLKNEIPAYDYPVLKYHYRIDKLLESISLGNSDNTTYVVTFGYVLVGNRSPKAITDFSNIIKHILNLSKECILISSDSPRNDGNDHNAGWDKLLRQVPDRINRYLIRDTYISKCVRLYN